MAQAVKTLSDLLSTENVTVLKRKNAAQSILIANFTISPEPNALQSVLFTLVNLHGNRHPLANWTTCQHFRFALGLHLKVPVILPRSSRPFQNVGCHVVDITRISSLL